MVQIWNGFKIAFSMYSKIPMPKSDWTEDNMRYAMCFFPLVGAVVGGLTLLWRWFSEVAGWQQTAFSAIVFVLLPAIVTGGIHVDGMIDTADALGSYQPVEKRLEILKDPRTGAFGVMQAIFYFAFYYGVYSLAEIGNGKSTRDLFFSIALVFVVSRALSGYAVVTFKKAKNTGLAAAFSNGAGTRAVQISMWIFFLASAVALCLIGISYAISGIGMACLVFFVYRKMSYDKFGGITGDLAGWFLQNCELFMTLGMTMAYWFF